MKAIIVFFVLSYLSLLLQSSWCILCNTYFVHLDPIPALICWFALNEKLLRGALTVAIFGLLASLFSCLSFFLFPLSYLTAFFTVYFIRANVLEIPNIQAYLITGFVSIEILVVQLAGSGSPELLWPWGIIQAILNIAIAPLVFGLCKKCIAILTDFTARFSHEQGN